MSGLSDILHEMDPLKDSNGNVHPGLTFDQLRSKYIENLANVTESNVITYYSGWLKTGCTHDLEIDDNDMNGFVDAVDELDASKGLVLVLHTPGGKVGSVEKIIEYLHGAFGNNIRVIVPQMAMSAGTMLAFSSKEIVMGWESSLGPIDPQMTLGSQSETISAHAVVGEWEQAKKDLGAGENVTYWTYRLQKCPTSFCIASRSLSLYEERARKWLRAYMFDGKDDAETESIIDKIIENLNGDNLSHDRHIGYEECLGMGLKVGLLDKDEALRKAVLSLHRSYMLSIDGMSAVKIIENQKTCHYVVLQ